MHVSSYWTLINDPLRSCIHQKKAYEERILHPFMVSREKKNQETFVKTGIRRRNSIVVIDSRWLTRRHVSVFVNHKLIRKKNFNCNLSKVWIIFSIDHVYTLHEGVFSKTELTLETPKHVFSFLRLAGSIQFWFPQWSMLDDHFDIWSHNPTIIINKSAIRN